MPARTKTTLSKPKLQLQLQAPAQPEPRSKKLKTSSSSSHAAAPDYSALDQFLFGSSSRSNQSTHSTRPTPSASQPAAKRFQLKNLRRKLPQLNLQSPPAESAPSRSRYDGPDDFNPLDLTELQAQLSLLTENLLASREALGKVETDRELWKVRAESLDRRARYLAKENRDLKARAAELEERLKVKTSIIETRKQREAKSQTPVYQKNEILLPSHEESSAVKALVEYHWSAQSELATNLGKSNDSCECVAANTIKTILKDSSRKVSPVLQAEILLDEMQQSPAGSSRRTEGKISNLNLHSPQGSQAGVIDEVRRQRKDALKRRIREARGFVEGLKRENDVLESILMSDGTYTPGETSSESSTSRRSDGMTRESARRMIDE